MRNSTLARMGALARVFQKFHACWMPGLPRRVSCQWRLGRADAGLCIVVVHTVSYGIHQCEIRSANPNIVALIPLLYFVFCLTVWLLENQHYTLCCWWK